MDQQQQFEAAGKTMRQFLHNSKQLRILIVGNVGSGKSSLINTLLNIEVAEVKAGLKSVTHDVAPFNGLAKFNGEVNGILVTLWDSPGLQGAFMDTKTKKELLSQIISECKGNVDLVVYCADMTQTRYTKGEDENIADLTGALGAEVWNKALFALTFANALRLPLSETCSIHEYFVRIHKEWTKKLHGSLATAKGGATDVPVIPVGHTKFPVPAPLSSQDWFIDFWLKCCDRMSLPGFTALFRINTVEVWSLPREFWIAQTFALKLENAKKLGTSNEVWKELDLALVSNTADRVAVIHHLLQEELPEYLSILQSNRNPN